MRLTIIIIFSFCLNSLNAGVFNHHSANIFPPPDSLPPAPPGQAEGISGPSSACVGDISVFSTDVPLACSCQWTVNGVVQSETGSPLTITWIQAGPETVAVVFVCNGQFSEPQSMAVSVFGVPEPEPISGDEHVCEYTYHTYTTVAGPGDSCVWTVNGETQPGFGPSITYSFAGQGTYLFQVMVFNPCGESSPEMLEVTAHGSAPAPPSPIQGPVESCTGNVDLYTTSVSAGESCQWRIDGIVQPSSSETLEVDWQDWGEHVIEVRAVSECGTGNPAVKNVQVMYQPEVFLGNDTTINLGQTLILDAGNPGSEYLWSTGQMSRTIAVTETGTYWVRVSNSCGTDNDTIDVSVYVGLTEIDKDTEDCFKVAIHGHVISFPDISDKEIKIQIVNLSGNIYYEGPPTEIWIETCGIYLIRYTSSENLCYRKILIN